MKVNIISHLPQELKSLKRMRKSGPFLTTVAHRAIQFRLRKERIDIGLRFYGLYKVFCYIVSKYPPREVSISLQTVHWLPPGAAKVSTYH